MINNMVIWIVKFHDKCYKTGLESPLVGAFRTQLELIEFKLY